MEMLPRYLKKNIGNLKELHEMKKRLRNHSLHTVCESAKCPNICECFKKGTATFMILGDKCTRSCAFCAVEKNDGVLYSSLVTRHSSPIDLDEPNRIALIAKDLGLKHVVVTSVTRDDLPDGGASVFASTIRAIKSLGLNMKVEVLTPDFKGNPEAIKLIVNEKPDIFAHNLETIPRLYPTIRKGADYNRSLNLLKLVKELNKDLITKSGIMVGLGETVDEVLALFGDLRKIGCNSLTVGHYLRPTLENVEIKEFISPETFKMYEEKGYEMGFNYMISGPFVRSSYLSSEILESANKLKVGGIHGQKFSS